MKASKGELLAQELAIMRIARQQHDRDLGLTTLYSVVKILATGTRFQADCFALCEELDAIYSETRSRKAPP